MDRILQAILGVDDVRIKANYRNLGSRLAIARDADVIIPSLDHLSLGQSVLFNLFITVVRYAESSDLRKSHSLDEIEGIVIIDEVDAHLHADLQFTTLPKLIRLFPRVQFILTTHAPLFMLGMEREFGTDSISIFELPAGEQISTERFSEFKRSLDFYRETKAFEAAIRESIGTSNLPTVFVEGETDRDYLHACLRILKLSELQSELRIEWVGNNIAGQAHKGGKEALNAVAKLFKAKPDLLKHKLLLLYDCDAGNRAEDFAEKLFMRTIPANSTNTKFRRGIENLLPESLAREEFYDNRVDQYGANIQILNKRRLCDWVIAQNDPAMFSGFEPVLEILQQFKDAGAALPTPDG